LECIRDPAGIEAGIAGYLDVYRRSWKVPEPFPDFDAALLRAAAAAGVLRLGLLWRHAEAVAAQYWIVSHGQAAVLKLAHDEAHRALSPGTVLTAWMIRGLIEEGVQALDFGRGDDPYKQLWTTQRRRRIGVVLARPWRPLGAVALGRQWAGAAIRRMRAASAIGGARGAP
jgi:CelD/BcsL family acetyltransferase involved in cellulose biosynthesis